MVMTIIVGLLSHRKPPRARRVLGLCSLLVMTGLVAGLAASPAQAATFPLPQNGDVVGELQSVVVKHEDTLSDIARRYDIGYDQIRRANPSVDPWVPREGTRIQLPTQFVLPNAPRDGIVLNLPEMRIYYYPKAKPGEPRKVTTFPVGIGREGWNTPVGQTFVSEKMANPSWYPPESIRTEHAAEGDPLPKVVPPGPDNPLGGFALYLGMKGGYRIHGTDKPYGIGMRVSHGCIRLYPEDIASLFAQVPVKTPVYVINQPYKLGWKDGQIYLEAHPQLSEQENAPAVTNLTPLVQAMTAKLGENKDATDWDKAMQVAQASQGIPAVITVGAKEAVSVADTSATMHEAASSPQELETMQDAAAAAEPDSNAGDQGRMPMPQEMDAGIAPEQPPAPEDQQWFVQVGAFRRPDNAARLAAQLQSLTPPIPAQRSSEDGVYRIMAGPYSDKDEADRVARRITTFLQIETRLVRPRSP